MKSGMTEYASNRGASGHAPVVGRRVAPVIHAVALTVR
jgi:hypothetical protein